MNIQEIYERIEQEYPGRSCSVTCITDNFDSGKLPFRTIFRIYVAPHFSTERETLEEAFAQVVASFSNAGETNSFEQFTEQTTI